MPRRKPGWTPALTHLKKQGVGRVRLPGRPDIYLGPRGVWPAGQRKPPPAVEREYRRIISEWLAGGGEQAAPPPDPEGLTIARLVNAYSAHVERNYRKRGKPTSQLRLVINATTPMLRLFPTLPAASFGARESRAVRDELLRGGTRSRSTISAYGSTIRTLFNWAESEGLVPETTALVVRGTRWFGRGQQQARRTPGRKRPVPIEDVEATLPHLPAAAAAMVRLQLLTAMRPEEVCFMRAGDFAEEDGLLRYEAREDANKLAHLGVSKIVYLGPQAQEVIRPFLEAARAVGPDCWLFCAPKAWKRGEGHYSPAYYGNVIRFACERAGVTRWSPGRLRHTRGGQVRRLYGKEGAQAEMGHLNPQQTGAYTDHVLDDLARKIARESG